MSRLLALLIGLVFVIGGSVFHGVAALRPARRPAAPAQTRVSPFMRHV